MRLCSCIRSSSVKLGEQVPASRTCQLTIRAGKGRRGAGFYKNHGESSMEAKRRLKPSEIAKMLRVSVEKGHTWIRNGELRAVNVLRS